MDPEIRAEVERHKTAMLKNHSILRETFEGHWSIKVARWVFSIISVLLISWGLRVVFEVSVFKSVILGGVILWLIMIFFITAFLLIASLRKK